MVGQLDGDGKVDVLVVNTILSLVKNTSTPGNFSFATPAYYTTQVTYNYINAAAIGDLDGDGKPDIAAANGADDKISIFRNQTGERNIRACSNTNVAITANSPGTAYQWQVNTGNGFSDIQNGPNYDGTNTSSLQIKNIPIEWNANQYRCVVDGVEGWITNITLNITVTPVGNISTTLTNCTNTDHVVEFVPVASIPDGSTVELWESVNGAAFTLKMTKTYFGYRTPFTVQFATAGTVRCYFRMIHPVGTPCAIAATTDTATITINNLADPVISSIGFSMTLTNSIAGVSYNWQVFTANNWVDLPGATGSTYPGIIANKYRVKASKAPCIKYSNELQMALTAIDPVIASGIGIDAYPNPATTVFVIDSLKLSDRWQTLEISGADGRKAFAPITIVNRKKVVLNIEALRPGVYFVILRRNNGAAAIVRLVKQ